MSFCGGAEEVLATLGISDGKSRWPMSSARWDECAETAKALSG